MKNLFLFLFLFQLSSIIIAQDSDEQDYILMEGKDTIFCEISFLHRSGGNVSQIKYTDLNNNKHEVTKDQIKTITFMRIGGKTLEYIPLKASKPDGYKRHIMIKVDGKTKVYDHVRLGASTNKKGIRNIYKDYSSGAAIYTIKLDNGKFYDIYSGSLKKIVVPYLLQCKEFEESFGNSITKKNIEQAVSEYNEVCQ